MLAITLTLGIINILLAGAHFAFMFSDKRNGAKLGTKEYILSFVPFTVGVY
jgi:hypothetical protein